MSLPNALQPVVHHRGRRRTLLISVASAACLSLFAAHLVSNSPNFSPAPRPLVRRILSWEPSSPPPGAPYWGLSCPLEDKAFSIEGRDRTPQSRVGARDAVAFSLKHDAPGAVKAAVLGGAFSRRRVILVGDSLTRQTFTSLACLTHSAGLWSDQPDAMGDAVIPWDNAARNRRYKDARIRFRDALGEIICSPMAGRVQDYFWKPGEKIGPMVGEEDWLQSCVDRRPFLLETYRLPQQRSGILASVPRFDGANPLLEKVPLMRDDLVVFNSGFHDTRRANRGRLSSLLRCMHNAGAKGEAHPDWPRFKFMVTSQQHFKTKNGLSDGTIANGCADANANPVFQREDLQLFRGRLPVIGAGMNMTNWGKFHIGSQDCYHWFQPGVPDVFAKEVAIAVQQDFRERESVAA